MCERERERMSVYVCIQERGREREGESGWEGQKERVLSTLTYSWAFIITLNERRYLRKTFKLTCIYICIYAR